MEKFYFEVPSLKRKKEAIEYINEFIEHNSCINGTGCLDDYVNNYEGWLKKLEDDYIATPSKDKVPSRTYFLIRNTDNKIVGMINIRLTLNEKLKKHGGNIGYSIRPTERKKGYNKINLYLGLKVCQKYKISEVLLDADEDNQASWKTIESLGGIKTKEFYDNKYKCITRNYIIKVDESINKYSSIYEPFIKKSIK